MSNQLWLARNIDADSSQLGVRAFAVNPESLTFAIGGGDQIIKLWDIESNNSCYAEA